MHSLPMRLREQVIFAGQLLHDGAQVIQVSNGPYGKTTGTMGSRPRVDTGRLGVVALVLGDDLAARRFLAALATGHPDRYAGFQTWETDAFEVGSGGISLSGSTARR